MDEWEESGREQQESSKIDVQQGRKTNVIEETVVQKSLCELKYTKSRVSY